MPAAFAVGTSEAIAGPSSAPSITMPWYFFDVTAFWNWEYCFCGLNAASNTARSTPSLAAAAFAPRRFAEFPDVEPAPMRKAMCTVPVGLPAELSAELDACPLEHAVRARSATDATAVVPIFNRPSMVFSSRGQVRGSESLRRRGWRRRSRAVDLPAVDVLFREHSAVGDADGLD